MEPHGFVKPLAGRVLVNPVGDGAGEVSRDGQKAHAKPGFLRRLASDPERLKADVEIEVQNTQARIQTQNPNDNSLKTFKHR